MNRKKLLKSITLLMILMFLMHSIISKFYWYSSVWFIDMVMHFLGGLWVGLFFFYVFYTREWFLNRILPVIFSVFLIGILWEFFEFFTFNYLGLDPFNLLDTVSDIFFDLSGGCFAVLYFIKKIMPIEENKIIS